MHVHVGILSMYTSTLLAVKPSEGMGVSIG